MSENTQETLFEFPVSFPLKQWEKTVESWN